MLPQKQCILKLNLNKLKLLSGLTTQKKYLKIKSGSREMAQWIKCMLLKPEDLSSVSRLHIKVKIKN